MSAELPANTSGANLSVGEYLAQLQSVLAQVDVAAVDTVVDLLWTNYLAEKRVVFCGNGGSASTASHLPADFQKNMQLAAGRPWECLSLVDSVPVLTAWSNDTSFSNVFAGQVKTWIRPGDVLVAISGSGNSPNILAAVEEANGLGGVTVGMSGYGGGKLARVAKHNIVVPSWNMQIVEDVHMALGHAIYTAVRAKLLAHKQAA